MKNFNSLHVIDIEYVIIYLLHILCIPHVTTSYLLLNKYV